MTHFTALPNTVGYLIPQQQTWSSSLCEALLYNRAEDYEPVEDLDETQLGAKLIPRVPNAFPSDLDYAGIPIIPGLSMVTAATGVGKTQFALNLLAALAEHPAVATTFVSFQEPDMFIESFNTLDDLATVLFSTSLPQVMVIDSFRLLQFSIGGTTRSGGVSSGLFNFLTELNNVAMRANVMIIGLFNPLSVDETIAERYEQEISSSVSQTIKLLSYDRGVFVSRHLDRKPRSFLLGSKPVLAEGDPAVAIEALPSPSPFNITNRIFGA